MRTGDGRIGEYPDTPYASFKKRLMLCGKDIDDNPAFGSHRSHEA